MKSNILFVLIDSFRADKCFGPKKTSLTPNIDSLKKDGVYFSQVISAGDGTAPSLGSLFTSLYPFRTGIRGEIPEKLKHHTQNYISQLKKYGYHAYACIPEYASSLGLTEPFENKEKTYSGYDPLSHGWGEKIVYNLESKLEEPWIYFIHLLDLHWPFSAPQNFQAKKFGDTQYDKSISAIDVWIGKFLNHINKQKNTCCTFCRSW